MPELPEVETVASALRPQLLGRTILGVRNTWPRHIDRPDLDEMRYRITGLQFSRVTRRAKFIVCPLNGGETLIIHLRMSGHLSVVPADLPIDKHTHTIFELDGAEELRFRDTRKFGRVYLVHDPAEILGGLGPEPLDKAFTPAALAAIIGDRKRLLKPFLLDQSVIAGVGNIYADEALFFARLHPERRTDTLTSAEITALHKGIQRALRLGIEREGASISTYVKPDGQKGDMQNAVNVFRRTGQTCYRCGGVIERIIVGGRSTHLCRGCQSKKG